MFIIELDPDCWIAPWSGDPGRTLVKESAKKYKTKKGAAIYLGMVKKYPWRNGYPDSKVVEV